MEGNAIYESLVSLVKSKNKPVHMHTQICSIHRQTHPNCLGCESKEGCEMVTACMLVITRGMAYPGKYSIMQDLDDMQKILDGRKDEVKFD